MRYLKYAVLIGLLAFSAGRANAQVAVSVGIGPGYVGPAPVCAYGYYGYYPYACAPVGYYGPQFFVGGVFIGAGPWFHGYHPYYGRGFYGRPGYGYNRPGIWNHGTVVHNTTVVRGGSGFRGTTVVRGGTAFHGTTVVRGNGGFHGSVGMSHSSGAGFHGGGGGHGGGHR